MDPDGRKSMPKFYTMTPDFETRVKSVLVGWGQEFQDAFIAGLTTYAATAYNEGYDAGSEDGYGRAVDDHPDYYA
jgi:hypothetical protein